MHNNWFRAMVVIAATATLAGAVPAKETRKPVGPLAKVSQSKAATKPANSSKKPAPKPKAPAPKKLPKMLEIGSTKCIPCKAMLPIVDSLKKEYKGQLEVKFIDITVDAKAAEKYGVKTIPTQIFFDAKGKEFFRHTGFFPKEEIIKTFKKHNIELKAPGKASR